MDEALREGVEDTIGPPGADVLGVDPPVARADGAGVDVAGAGGAGDEGAGPACRRTALAGGAGVAFAVGGAALAAAARAIPPLSFGGGAIEPTAVTSAMRRTRASEEIRLSAIPPGVHVSSFGTRRTARGSPRGGRSADRTVLPSTTVAGVHQRGGATAAPAPVPRSRTGVGAARARRITMGRDVAAANRIEAEATAPTEPVRARPARGPGKRSRRPTSSPNAFGGGSGVLIRPSPASST